MRWERRGAPYVGHGLEAAPMLVMGWKPELPSILEVSLKQARIPNKLFQQAHARRRWGSGAAHPKKIPKHIFEICIYEVSQFH